METHFEILIDASGSMGYMKGEKDEAQFLLPDGKSTRTDLVKTILTNSFFDKLSFTDTIGVSTFRKSFHKNSKGERLIKTRPGINKQGQKVPLKYYSDFNDLKEVYNGVFNQVDIEKAVLSIINPLPGGTPLWWALSVLLNQSKDKIRILVLSDGDANDKVNFDEETLKLIDETKKDCTINFIGISQGDVASKKSKNLAEKTGGIYTNLKALNYDRNALNVLLSKLNTTIIGNVLKENIKETQAIAKGANIDTPIVEDITAEIENKEVTAEQAEEEQSISFGDTLEKQVHKNTASLEYISGQLNNILSLLHSKDQVEEEVIVSENKTHNERIGRLAEEFIYKKLQELFKDASTKVKWLNEDGEKGMPYDFLLEKDEDLFYYECKGSASDLNEFQLTKNEWDFYLGNKEKYRLCFVRNVDTFPQYVRFMDLLKDMEESKLTPCATKNKAYKANRIMFHINNINLKWT